MEKLKFIIPILLLFTINSCIIDRTPDYVNACFTITGTDHNVNEPVYFVNCSQYADSYDWSFGDGFTSNQRNPSHTYSLKGTYQVTMTAYGYNHETFSDVITIGGSTDLDILVMFEGTEIVVPDCEVTLYGSYEDWNTFNNPIVTDYTNTNGIVVFKGLDPVVYFIDAYLEGDGSYYSNEELGIETVPLAEDEINYYNIYLRQYFSSKRDRIGVPIVKIEKSSKEEHGRIIKANLNK